VADTPPPPTSAPATEAPPTPAPAPFQEANYKAAYLQNPTPHYPAMARERRWQGEVQLRVRILADGTAGEIRLERSSGHEALDEAAMESVQHWRFVPAKEGDKAVDSWAIIPIAFKLKS
jgi:protein TonB